MKIYFILTAILFISALTLPLLTPKADKTVCSEPSASSAALTEKTSETTHVQATVQVMKSDDGNVINVNLFEYITGCVAGEMPASFSLEALKAQAVACYTYTKYIQENKADGDTYISDSPDIHQCYIDKTSQKAKWGNDYEEYRNRIEEAVRSVFGEFLTYEDKTAMTVYHASSNVKTKSASEIWNKNVPYLISVSAPSDKTDTKEYEFTAAKLRQILERKGKISLSDNEALHWIKVTEKDENGCIRKIEAGNKSFTALEISNYLSLQGTSFTGKLENNIFTFRVNGKGHGVGLSQQSAEYFALRGKSYREILAHFYPGTKLERE